MLLDLSNKMGDVGALLILFAVLGLLGAWAGAQQTDIDRPQEAARLAAQLLQSLVIGIIGAWTRSAAYHFHLVATTSGSDMRHLMDALQELLKIYRLQWLLVIVGHSLIVVIIVIVVLMHTSM